MPNMTDGLNAEQSQAVLSESKRILMLAGAGTGKTRTLTHRLAHLNLNCRVGTSSILAITFTRTAAKEMKDRLGPLIGEKEAKKLTCCTFHALAVRILQEWSQRLGLDKQFSIYSQEDREEVIKSILTKFGYKTTLSKVLEKRSSNVMSEESAVWKEYQWQLKRFNAVDLDDLIPKVNYLFARYADVTEYYRRQWKYVFVDEFQDTNMEQLQLIKLLNPDNLFGIGDDFQTIYSFNGARVENILEFPQEFPGTEVIKLEQNYRSTEPIIKAANNLISHNLNQTEKTLISNKDGLPYELLSCSDQDAEAGMIAELIATNGFGEKYSDYAVLARTNAQIDFVYQKLRSKGIPCILLGGRDDPLKKPDIKSLIAYLACIFNPKDETNFKRVLRFPEPVMTDLQWQQMEQIAIDKSITLKDAMGYSGVPQIYDFAVKFDILADFLRGLDTISQAFCFLTQSPMLNLEERYRERSLHNRIEDLQEANQYIYYWQERQLNMGEDLSPQAFLKWVRIRDITEKLMEERDAVKLMTIHGSKGLEFPTVFLIGMNEGIFPSKNTRDMEEERRLAYVAVTRAKNNLVISANRTASSWGKTEECEPSRFIEEMGGLSNEVLHGMQEGSSGRTR